MFDAGDALMKDGRIHEACPKYAESYRLDPRLGVLLHWADCLEQDGKLASAYAAFRDAVELAERSADSRSEFAAARVRALEPKLSRIVIDAPHAGLPPDATILLDSLSIVASGLGVGIAVDPGAHTIRASAPNYVPFTSSVLVTEGEVQRVTIPALEHLAPTQPDSSMSAAPSDLARATTPKPVSFEPKPALARASNSQKWLGLGVGGAGVVALSAGAVFFGSMVSALDQRAELCPVDPCPPNTDREQVRALESQAKTAEAWGLTLSISGAVAVIVGTVLYVRAPSNRAQPRAWQPRPATNLARGLEWRF